MGIRIGIYGYGNLGKGVELAIKQNPDLTAVGVFTRRDPSTLKTLTGLPVYAAEDADKMQDQIDVMILCGGSATDLPTQTAALAAHFTVNLLYGTVVAVAGKLEAKHVEKLNVNGQGREPFFATDYKRRAHEMIVDCVRKMIGGNTVRFQNNHVLVVLRYRDFTLYRITEGVLLLNVALRTKTDYVRLARFDVRDNFLFRQVAATSKLAIVARKKLVLRLMVARRFQILLRTEARVCESATD